MNRFKGRALAIAGVLALSALTACGNAGGGAGTAVDQSRLTIGYEADPAAAGFDPHKVTEGQRQFFEGFYDSLLTLKSDGTAGPGLATDFSYNADQTVLTLTLKSGVTFSDGSSLSPELVKANFDRRSDTALVAMSSLAKGAPQEIVSVDVVGADKVSITFAKPQPGFEKSLTSTIGMIIGKNAVGNPDQLATGPDGSGPYTLNPEGTIKGNKYVLSKNDKNDKAKDYSYSTIVFSVIPDPQARANALVSGQTDVSQLTSPTVSLVESKGLKVSKQGGTIQTMVAFDKMGKIVPAFGEEKVRQAIQYAINRQALVDALHKGDVPAWNALPKGTPGFTEELNDKYTYDPERAKSLLAEAGYADGFSFEISVSAQTQTDMQAVQKDLAAVGIKMQPKLASSTEEAFAAVQTTALGYLPVNWDNPVALMYGIVLEGFTNVQKATDAELAAATGAAAAATNDEARKEALTKMNVRLIDAGWMFPLYESLTNQGYNSKKLDEVIYPGTNTSPLLSSYKPAN